MLKRWSVAKLNKDRALVISNDYGLPQLISMLLDIRGIYLEEDIKSFLFDIHMNEHSSTIKDIQKASERIKEAIESKEKICVYGDFDADGVTSTALLYSYLGEVGADVMFYIPSREDEGYGMNKNAIDKLYEEKVKLIITVDNGIAAYDEIEYANSLGMVTIVTDHHMPPEILPNAFAVVDPHRIDCPSKFKDLSGVGVALKLVMQIEAEYTSTDFLLDAYSDIAAIGTIGDIVPLLGENRAIVKHGLDHINNRERVGINALIDESGYSDKEITTGSVSFSLVPRINACGRLGLSNKSVDMLITDDEKFAAEIASELGFDNQQRQKIEKDILEEIDAMIEKNPSIVQNKVIVIVGEKWHQGVIGIVASRIKEIYGRPSIVITRDGDIYRGSGRSVQGFSLIEAISQCKGSLVQYGGHPMAVGFGIEEKSIHQFIKAINSLEMVKEIPKPSINLDCKLNPAQLSVSIVKSLDMLEPYGAGNPKPLFGLYHMMIKEIRELSGGKHIKLLVARGDTIVPALKFNTTIEECPFEVGDEIDLAVSLDTSDFNGQEQLSVVVRDYKFSDIDMEYHLNSMSIFESFCRGDDISKEEAMSIIPTRNDCAIVYKYLKANNGFNKSCDVLLYRIGNNMPYGKLRVILEMMNEKGLIKIYEGMKETKIEICDVKGKVDLSSALILTKLKEVSTGG